MKFLETTLKQLFLISLVTLFLSVILESMFPQLVTRAVAVDKLLEIAIFVGVCWAMIAWQVNYFVRKSNST